MQKVTLKKVYSTDTDKEGNKLMGKNGKPYTRMSIQTEEHGDRWISGFQNASNKEWKEGDTVELVVEEKGEYLNFKVPNKSDAKVGELEARVAKLEAVVFKKSEDIEPVGENVDEEVNVEDIDF